MPYVRACAWGKLHQVMSGNLELVRSIYAALEGGDFSSPEWTDPEIEGVFADGPTAGGFTGVAAMTERERACFTSAAAR